MENQITPSLKLAIALIPSRPKPFLQPLGLQKPNPRAATMECPKYKYWILPNDKKGSKLKPLRGKGPIPRDHAPSPPKCSN